MLPVVVVGAGPAGLATSYALRRGGVDHLVLEAGEIGQTWASLYDSLVLHTGKHMSALPGQPFTRATPLFPPRALFLDYLRDYASTQALPIRTSARVTAVERDASGLTLRLRGVTAEAVRARAIVWCTGVVSEPYTPEWADRGTFRGEVLHAVAYRRPDAFRGRRVLIVGAGNSAGEIAAELGQAGVAVTLAVRSGAFVVPRTIAAIPIQYVARYTSLLPIAAQRTIQRVMTTVGERVRGSSGLPRPDANGPTNGKACRNIPLIGFHLTNAIRARQVRVRPGLRAWLPDGVRFDDGSEDAFDVVMLATGYRSALGPLGGLVQRDACGFARRRDRVVSLDQPDLYFVGQTYDVRGALFNIAHDAQHVARLLK